MGKALREQGISELKRTVFSLTLENESLNTELKELKEKRFEKEKLFSRKTRDLVLVQKQLESEKNDECIKRVRAEDEIIKRDNVIKEKDKKIKDLLEIIEINDEENRKRKK